MLRLHQRKLQCMLSSCATVRRCWRSSGAMATSTVVSLHLPKGMYLSSAQFSSSGQA